MDTGGKITVVLTLALNWSVSSAYTVPMGSVAVRAALYKLDLTTYHKVLE